VVSPILYEGLVYLVNDRGVITAMDARTGDIKYEGGRVPAPGLGQPSHLPLEGGEPLSTGRASEEAFDHRRSRSGFITDFCHRLLHSRPARRMRSTVSVVARVTDFRVR